MGEDKRSFEEIKASAEGKYETIKKHPAYPIALGFATKALDSCIGSGEAEGVDPVTLQGIRMLIEGAFIAGFNYGELVGGGKKSEH